MVFSAKEMEAAWNSKSVYVCLCMIVGVDEFLSHVNGAYMDLFMNCISSSDEHFTWTKRTPALTTATYFSK